jgi:hypothetical protein
MSRLKKQETVPTLANLLLLSNGGDAYHWACSKLLQAVVGSSVWNKRYFKEMLSDFVTISDETFLILTIENNYQRWVDEAKHRVKPPAQDDDDDDDDEDNETWKENLAPAKYTNSGASMQNGRGSNRRCGGWSKSGYLRFNELHCLVKEDRKLRANFESELKSLFVAEHADENGKEDSDDGEEIIPANDMTGVKQPVQAAFTPN